MKTSICLICSKEFNVPNWRIGKAKYCSPQCSYSAKKTEKSYDKPRKCIDCGKEFVPTQWYQKSCSRKCFVDHSRKTGVIKCKNCSKEFKQARKSQVYCSRKCSNPWKEKQPKKPKHVNLDKIWSEVIKKRAGGKCEYCGKETGLNSHHIFSRSNKRVRWEVDNGICVCVSHHIFGLFSAHKSPIEFVEWLKEYRGVEWYERLRSKSKLTVKFKKPNKEEEDLIRKKLIESC